jgi:diguanylate cyclase (GGDEF)-like protein/PAS domain S-box-containing protein
LASEREIGITISGTLTSREIKATMGAGLKEREILLLEAKIAELEHLLDVSEKAFQEQTLRLESALAAADRMRYQSDLLLNSTWEGILGLDLRGNHRFVNPAAARMLGYRAEELIGQHSHATWYRKTSDGKANPLEECPLCASIMAGGVHQGSNVIFWRKDGTCFPVEYTCTPIVQGEQTIGAVLTFWDITDRQQAQEAQARSLIDELTGLYNRRGFFTLAEHQYKLTKRSHKGMALFFGDLDELKTINDTLGHMEGDHALIDTANILRKTFREIDIMARIGGDEFVVLITEPADTKGIMRRLQQNLDCHNNKIGRPYRIALSIGIAHYNPLFPSSIEELVRHADISMYEDKRRKQDSSL